MSLNTSTLQDAVLRQEITDGLNTASDTVVNTGQTAVTKKAVVSQLAEKATSFYTGVEELALQNLALTYRANHAAKLALQYDNLSACFGAASDKLYKDICKYVTELVGINGLSDGLVAYATESGNVHIATDLVSHGAGIKYEGFYSSAPLLCGKSTGVITDTPCFTFPVLRSGDTLAGNGGTTPTTEKTPTLIALGSSPVTLRFAYSATGDAYIQYPINSTSPLTNAMSLARDEAAGTVTAWYNWYDDVSHTGDETAARLTLHFFKTLLNPDSGPYYLVLNVGSSASTTGGEVIITATARTTGTWAYDSDCVVVSDDADETLRASDVLVTCHYAWPAGTTDGSAIKLPIPTAGTADLVSTAGAYYNAITITITPVSGLSEFAYYLQ